MRPSKSGTLEFDYDKDHAVVHYRKPTMKGLREIAALYETDDEDEAVGLDLLKLVCDRYLLSWNVEDDDGNAVPLTFDNMLDMPGDFVFMVLQAWTNAAMGDATPLDLNSIDLSNLSLGSGSLQKLLDTG